MRSRTLLPAILCSNRADGTCDFANARAYEFTGMSPGSLEGLKWLDPINPEDRPRVQSAWLTGVRAGVPFAAEYRLRRADGFTGIAIRYPGRIWI